MVSMPHWPIYLGPETYPFEKTIFRMKEMLNLLDNPQKKLKNVFHITGTKGKGSTAMYISNILFHSNYNVGIYTSPHIYKCNERIKYNLIDISDEELNELTYLVKNAFSKSSITEQLTSFESLTLTAFLFFARKNCDINVFEVGMGGLFDATNVFDANQLIGSIITPIHKDHAIFLGNDLLSIANHKAGIIKQNLNNIIISSQTKIVMDFLIQNSKEKNVTNIFSYNQNYEIFEVEENENLLLFELKNENKTFLLPKPNLIGKHQYINFATAFMAILTSKLKINYEKLENAIKNVKHIVRLQKIENKNLIDKLPKDSIFYIDGAHNELAAFALKNFIIEQKKIHLNKQFYIIIARSANVDNEAMLRHFVELDLKIICTCANEPASEPAERINIIAKKLNLNSVSISFFPKIIDFLHMETKSLFVIACGSLYIARNVSDYISKQKD